MRKATFIILLIPALIFAASFAGPLEQAACAAPAAHGGHGGGGNVGRGGGGNIGRAGGGRVGHFEGRGFGGPRGHFGHGGHFRGNIWIGPGWGWWDPFYYPYYPYPYPYPYYSSPTVVVPEESPEYIAPAPQPEESGYWYYCKDSKGYYPYVKSCPSGWMKVVPSPLPPDQEQED